jgi:hypothetical protein
MGPFIGYCRRSYSRNHQHSLSSCRDWLLVSAPRLSSMGYIRMPLQDAQQHEPATCQAEQSRIARDNLVLPDSFCARDAAGAWLATAV